MGYYTMYLIFSRRSSLLFQRIYTFCTQKTMQARGDGGTLNIHIEIRMTKKQNKTKQFRHNKQTPMHYFRYC